MHTLPDKPEWLRRVTILGVGLLGGSVAKSLRRSGVRVVGFSRREESCRAAVDAGATDESYTDLARACQGSDVVVIAAPVNRIADLAVKASEHLGPQALITDVGSTKAKIVCEIRDQSPATAARLIAAHPIAGSEKTGVENATETLLDGKATILTPGADADPVLLERAMQFWRQTGSHLIVMTPEEHDRRLAAISHVPHLISSLLARLPDEEALPLIGSGWKDMTRVAAGDPGMWTAICEHNRAAILQELDRVEQELALLRACLAADGSDALKNWLADAKRRKESTID